MRHVQKDTELEPLLAKIKSASHDNKRLIARFVDFVLDEEANADSRATMKLSEESFAKVWDNSDDAVYDKL